MDRTAVRRISRAARHLGDVVWPPQCVLCDRHGFGICAPCASLLRPPPAGPPHVPPPPGIDHLVALCSYDDRGRALVLALKRRNRRDAVPQMGRALGGALSGALDGALGPIVADRPGRTDVRDGHRPVLLTWAPTSRARVRERGYDQAALLARSIAGHKGWPATATLRRTGAAQMGRSRADRLHGPQFTSLGAVEGTVVVVDDVVTTGATMAAAAAALRRAGASAVLGVAVAVSP